MSDALFGYTGFVGSNLARHRHYDCLYNSANAHEARSKTFDRVVCAAAPGEKWRANLDPRTDWIKISALIETLHEIACERFVLVSTVDVREDMPYGAHRLSLEGEVRKRFPASLILRLPALFGPGLKKNALYDLMRDNHTDRIAPNAVYQWFPVILVGGVIDRALAEGRKMLTLTSDPISMREIRDRFFPGRKLGDERADAPNYGISSISPAYHLSRDQVMGRMTDFLGR